MYIFTRNECIFVFGTIVYLYVEIESKQSRIFHRLISSHCYMCQDYLNPYLLINIQLLISASNITVIQFIVEFINGNGLAVRDVSSNPGCVLHFEILQF